MRAGQAAGTAAAAGVATFMLPRYASPVAIMAHTMRAILLGIPGRILNSTFRILGGVAEGVRKPLQKADRDLDGLRAGP